MPSISSFYGITIMIRFNDHEPAHIHARYAEYNASVSIETGDVIEGDLPIRARVLVSDWIQLNREELLKQWKTKVITKLPPLK